MREARPKFQSGKGQTAVIVKLKKPKRIASIEMVKVTKGGGSRKGAAGCVQCMLYKVTIAGSFSVSRRLASGKVRNGELCYLTQLH